MRIIAGSLKSRRIRAPRGRSVRPTSDRARESLFNILGDAVRGSSFLDLFAGSGAVGLEAASRGASPVVFVERDPAIVKVLTGNIESLDVSGLCRVIPGNWVFACRRLHGGHHRFDIIFADPPYDSRLAEMCLLSSYTDDILLPGGLLVIEHRRMSDLPDPPDYLTLARKRAVGEAVFSIFKKEV